LEFVIRQWSQGEPNAVDGWAPTMTDDYETTNEGWYETGSFTALIADRPGRRAIGAGLLEPQTGPLLKCREAATCSRLQKFRHVAAGSA